MGTLVVEFNQNNSITVLAPPQTFQCTNAKYETYSTPIKVAITNNSYSLTSNPDGTVSSLVDCTYPPAISSKIQALLTFRLISPSSGQYKIDPTSMVITFKSFSWTQGNISNIGAPPVTYTLTDPSQATNNSYYLQYHLVGSSNSPSDTISKTPSDVVTYIDNDYTNTVILVAEDLTKVNPTIYPGRYQTMLNANGTYTTIGLLGYDKTIGRTVYFNLNFGIMGGSLSNGVDPSTVKFNYSYQPYTFSTAPIYHFKCHLTNTNGNVSSPSRIISQP